MLCEEKTIVPCGALFLSARVTVATAFSCDQ